MIMHDYDTIKVFVLGNEKYQLDQELRVYDQINYLEMSTDGFLLIVVVQHYKSRDFYFFERSFSSSFVLTDTLHDLSDSVVKDLVFDSQNSLVYVVEEGWH